jgi:hypothetical protein
MQANRKRVGQLMMHPLFPGITAEVMEVNTTTSWVRFECEEHITNRHFAGRRDKDGAYPFDAVWGNWQELPDASMEDMRKYLEAVT